MVLKKSLIAVLLAQALVYELVMVSSLGMGDSNASLADSSSSSEENALPPIGYIPSWVLNEQQYPCGRYPYCPHGSKCYRPYLLTEPLLCINDAFDMDRDLVRGSYGCQQVAGKVDEGTEEKKLDGKIGEKVLENVNESVGLGYWWFLIVLVILIIVILLVFCVVMVLRITSAIVMLRQIQALLLQGRRRV